MASKHNALSCAVSYGRLMRWTVHYKSRWFAQLVLKGSPWHKPKHSVAEGQTAGLDIGPSTIAAVGDEDAFLARCCDELAPLDRYVRRIQRAMDRSRRATNPENYHPDGTVRSGAKRWRSSSRYQALSADLAEKQRRLAATRKRAHGRMANRILAMGADIKTESLSYEGFYKNFGRSIRDRAPKSFMACLRRKVANAGGQITKYATRTIRLSQTWVCGRLRHKPLSGRWHRYACGVSAQRDLYSAFLARYVEPDRLVIPRAKKGPGRVPNRSLGGRWQG